MASDLKSSDACEGKDKVTPKLIVQCGAYYAILFKEHEGGLLQKITNAAEEGYSKMLNGGTAVDAVEETIRILEDDPYFNAGHGSLLNASGEIECDAMIMDGNTLGTGAVMAASHFSNPVMLCRKIMEQTNHCAMTGEGALKFAQDKGFDHLICDPKELRHTETNLRAAKMDLKKILGCFQQTLVFDTVAAVALDSNGHFACATSTGGIPRKMKGRISDAPLVGCGGYANEYGAATSSGFGEVLIKMTLARDVVYNIESGKSAMESSRNAVNKMKTRFPEDGFGSVIAIDKDGNFGKTTNAVGMLWATCNGSEVEHGFTRRQELVGIALN